MAIPGVRLLYDSPAAMEDKLNQVAALGAGWLRFDAAWPEIESARGRYDFSRVDRALAAARIRGLRVLLVLGGTAQWARPAGTDWNHGPADEASRAGFATFAGLAAQRYRGQASGYEIWNEPNLPGAWAPHPDPRSYLELVRVAYAAVHRADPSALVLSGGTGGGTTGIDPVRWYRTLYATGLQAVSDGIAVHPYPDAGHRADSGEMKRARLVRAVLDDYGDRHKPLWGTETGAATAGGHTATERQQSNLVTDIYRQWSTIHDTGPLLYYTLEDFGGTGAEDNFGLRRTDGTAKPAFDTLRRTWSQSPRR